MKDLTHERCSELLGSFAAGRLDALERSDVEAHLSTCPDCSLELAGLNMLLGSVIEPLSGSERDELTRAVRASLAPPKASFSERFGRRFAPALGAVAFLAIAVVALISLPSDEPSTTTGGGGDSADVESVEEQVVVPEAAEGAPAQKAGRGAGEGDTGSTTTDSAAGKSASAEVSGTALRTRADLKIEAAGFADVGLDLSALVPSISPKKSLDAFNSATGELALSAPNRRVARRIRECTQTTVSTSPHPLVPASAVYYGDDVLVISFVWLEPSTAILNYELRGWLDEDCSRVSPIYRRGLVE